MSLTRMNQQAARRLGKFKKAFGLMHGKGGWYVDLEQALQAGIGELPVAMSHVKVGGNAMQAEESMKGLKHLIRLQGDSERQKEFVKALVELMAAKIEALGESYYRWEERDPEAVKAEVGSADDWIENEFCKVAEWAAKWQPALEVRMVCTTVRNLLSRLAWAAEMEESKALLARIG